MLMGLFVFFPLGFTLQKCAYFTKCCEIFIHETYIINSFCKNVLKLNTLA
jgi:hypothetical protein